MRRVVAGIVAVGACLLLLGSWPGDWRSEEHTSELQSQSNLVCRLLLEKKKLYHTDAFSSTVTSPTSTAVGATKADGWTFGLFPSKLNSGMVSTLAVCSECSHLTRSLEGGKVEWRSRGSPPSRP